jgi:hypothetical protein
MGNINFAHNSLFSWYCILLMLSGIALLVISAIGSQTTARRVVRAVIGLGFFCYGFYLTFVFTGGHYFMFLQAFLLPVLLIVDWFRAGGARRQRRAVATAGPYGSQSGQP